MSEAGAILSRVTTQPRPVSVRIAGIVTTGELLSAGWRPDQIRANARTGGDLLVVRRGIYADGAHARKLLSLKGGGELLSIGAAVALTGGTDAVVSHQSAACLHKISLVGHRDSAVHLTRPPGAGWRGGTGIRQHCAGLPAQQVTQHLGLSVTTAARTVVDLARVLPFSAGVVAADSALHQRLATKDELRSVLAGCSRWRGASVAADVIAFADGRSESPLESIARVVFRDCGLPPPRLQALVGTADAADEVARVDFFWDKYRTIVEVDGALKYADPLRARAQLERDAWLRSLGYEVVHFTWDDITRSPEFVASRIRDAFRRGTLLAAARNAAG
jgi:Protein of unknown function (DUF559)